MTIPSVLSDLDLSPLPHAGTSSSLLPSLLSVFFIILGGIAVLVIVIAGFKYVISQGEPAQTAKAKNTIIYAVIGLAVCILAQFVVKFVLDKF